MTEADRRKLLGALASCGLGVVTLLPFFWLYSPGVHDEALGALGASRLLAGEVPYLDFHTRTTPGTYYVLAAIYLVTGENLFGTRLLVLLLGAGMALALYLLACRVFPGWWAGVPVALFALTGVTHFPVVNHHWLSSLVHLFGVLALVAWRERPTFARAAGVGALVALAWWFLQSDGAALGLTAALAFLIWKPPAALKHWAFLGGGFLASSAALWAPVVRPWTVGSVIAQNLIEPPRYHMAFNRSPYSLDPLLTSWQTIVQGLPSFRLEEKYLFWLGHSLSYFGVWVVKHGLFYVVLLLAALALWRAREGSPALVTSALALAVVALVQSGRQDMLYVNYLTPLFYLLLSWLIWRFLRPAALWAGLLLALFAVQYAFGVSEGAAARYSIVTPRGTFKTADPVLARTLTELYARAARLTPPGSLTLAFPYAPDFIFYSGTRSVMKPLLMLPIHNPRRDFEELVAAVREREPEVIYYFPLGPGALSAYPTVDRERFWREMESWESMLLQGYTLEKDMRRVKIYRRGS